MGFCSICIFDSVKKVRYFSLLLAPVLVFLFFKGPVCVWAEGESFKVIVHTSNPVSSMTREQISKLFLKKETHWESGFKVTPVDQVLESPTGSAFSMAVHGKKAKEIKGHWVKIVFSGLGTPPMQLKKDQEVLDFVRHNVGGIGYISAETPAGEGVKVINISD